MKKMYKVCRNFWCLGQDGKSESTSDKSNNGAVHSSGTSELRGGRGCGGRRRSNRR